MILLMLLGRRQALFIRMRQRPLALDAAKQWTFRKWEKDGKPVKVEGVLNLHFTLK
jgi:hypothetical protein